MSLCRRRGLSQVSFLQNIILHKDKFSDSFYIPSEVDRRILAGGLRKGREELERLGMETDDMVHSVIELCSSALSALRRLPTEILEEIFEYFHASTFSHDTWSDACLVRLMLVCRRWSNVVRSHQRLWSNIRVEHCAVYDIVRFQSLMETRLKFCPTYPLHLDFTLEHKPSSDPEDIKLVIAVTCQTRQRWETVRVHMLASHARQFFKMPTHYPLLKRLNLHIDTDSEDDDNITGIIKLTAENVPLLHDLELNYHSGWLFTEFPWNRLVRLVAKRLSERGFSILTGLLGNVQTFKVNLSGWPSPQNLPVTYEYPTTLHTLSFTTSDPKALLCTLERLKTLSLCSLIILLPYHLAFFRDLDLVSHPIHQHITSLDIKADGDSFYSAPNVIVQVLTLLPALECLILRLGFSVQSTNSLDDLMRELQHQNITNFSLCPLLASLILVDCRVSAPLFLDTITIRLGKAFDGSSNLSFLSHIQLIFCLWVVDNSSAGGPIRYVEDDTISRLAELCGPGWVHDQTNRGFTWNRPRMAY